MRVEWPSVAWRERTSDCLRGCACWSGDGDVVGGIVRISDAVNAVSYWQKRVESLYELWIAAEQR